MLPVRPAAAPEPSLRPVEAALAGLRRRGLGPAGVADPLVVADTRGWEPATGLLDGSRLPALLEYPAARWNAAPHASATLAWKAYTYWLAHLVLLGWTSRRVPRLSAENTLVRLDGRPPYVTVGLRTGAMTAVGTDRGRPGAEVTTVGADDELLAVLREELLERHLIPLAAAIRQRTAVGSRTLWGEVAAGLGRVADRTRPVRGGPPGGDLVALLHTLGVDHLVGLRSERTGRVTVRRRTCCLAFTVSGLDGPCADCRIPASRTTTSRQERSR
ncbi:hypothetical protein [Streptomyces sp.]|uniref:hypothetical protein n=1 Tax=Streptomyces sp. TaxID=1931 RepID=UPI002F3E527F